MTTGVNPAALRPLPAVRHGADLHLSDLRNGDKEVDRAVGVAVALQPSGGSVTPLQYTLILHTVMLKYYY